MAGGGFAEPSRNFEERVDDMNRVVQKGLNEREGFVVDESQLGRMDRHHVEFL